MPLDLHLLLIWLTAYMAAGMFYVLRGPGEAWGAIGKDDLTSSGWSPSAGYRSRWAT